MNRAPLIRLLVTASLCGVLTACIPTLLENPARDVRRAMPERFQLKEERQNPETKNEAPAPLQNWKEFFASPQLRELIELGLANNQELNIQLQEIIIAQNEVSARRGEYLPRVRAGVGAQVDKVGAFTSQGFSDKATGLPETLGNFSFGLVASWEVDIWGRLRNAASAADFRAQASVEGRRFMVTQLVAEMARSYFELTALDAQVEVLKRNIELQKNALEIIALEKTAARVTQLAVQRFQAEILKNKSRLYALEQERVQAENRINFLAGRFPQPVARSTDAFSAPVPNAMRAGLPSQLLENRPDVRQAELQLAAAKLDVNVARASFYPSLSLDAAVGYRAFNPAHLVTTPESLFANLAGNLVAPLLNRAAIAAQYRSANARQIQAVYTYERALLQAFTDVVNQLARFENLSTGYQLQVEQVETLTQAIETSKTLFQSARADYVEVLLTRRDSLDAELEMIETKKRLLMTTVNVYQALGGGWQSDRNNAP